MSKSEVRIYIDDSGDPGFKFQRGSTRMFVIACVIFDDKESEVRADKAIIHLKEQLGWKQEYEFKHHKTSRMQKEAFYESIIDLNFKVIVMVIDKKKLKEERENRLFYIETICKALSKCRNGGDARIYLDGKSPKLRRKDFILKMKRCLAMQGVKVGKISLANSKNYNLVQMADMIAGAVRVEYDPEKKLKHSHLGFITTRGSCEVKIYKN